MPTKTRLTPAEQQMLGFLTHRHATPGHLTSPKMLAKDMWPDSPAWEKRTRGRRTGTQNGQVGGTMPMLAAKILHALEDAGCAEQVGEFEMWAPTDLGVRVAAGNAAPKTRQTRTAPPRVQGAPKNPS